MAFTIDRENFKTETGKKLYDLLNKIWDDNDFIGGVMADVKGDVNRQKLIDLIEKDGINDSDTISLAAIDIAEGDL